MGKEIYHKYSEWYRREKIICYFLVVQDSRYTLDKATLNMILILTSQIFHTQMKYT